MRAIGSIYGWWPHWVWYCGDVVYEYAPLVHRTGLLSAPILFSGRVQEVVGESITRIVRVGPDVIAEKNKQAGDPPMRVYFCRWIGSGTDGNPFRLTIFDHLSFATRATADSYDLRIDPANGDGWCVVWLPSFSELEHQSIIADPMCVYVPRDALPAVIPQLMREVTDVVGLSRALTDRGKPVNGIGIDTSTLAALLAVFPDMV